MRVRNARPGDAAIPDAVSRLLPQLTPAAVLLTDDPDEAVHLLSGALGAPGALVDPKAARLALVRSVSHRPRWPAEQVIETAAAPPVDDDTALAGALRALPDRLRASAVLNLVAGVGDPGTDETAVTELRKEL